tara:strand:- start:3292 stop:3699 length:408 start_codon:yes stop_codon:yes gene_type:complete
MATRSRIGIQLSDDSILSAYHHWDGYPEWLGRILKTHYNSKSKASELIDGGDMSSCWTNCGWQNETRPETGPQYYSERGEDCPPSLMTKEEYLDKLRNEEYAYIFRDGEWICYNMNEFNDNDPEIVEIPEGALAA